MKMLLGAVMFGMVLQSQSCDLNQMMGKGPAQIEEQAEKELQKFFPRVQVHASPERETIMGFTCTANLGKAVIEQMIPLINQSAGIAELKKYRKYAVYAPLAELVGAKITTYRYFGLGFDQHIILFDVDAQQYKIVDAKQIPDYETSYAEECNIAESSSSTATASNSAFIWIGFFEVSLDSGRDIRIFDTLGLYTENDFAPIREQEISSREQLIKEFLRMKGESVVSVRLDRIEKIAVPAGLDNR